MPAKTPVYQNISKLFDSEGTPLVPSAYAIKEIILTNVKGDSKNIAEFITSFNIIEELYSPIIICNINIRDDENLFEEFLLQGQEKIQIGLEIVPYEGAKGGELNVEFLIKEYPNFRKTIDAVNVQEYSLVAMSNFAYVSQLTRVCKAIPTPGGDSNGDPTLEIKDIFEKNLEFSPAIFGQISDAIGSIARFFKNIGLNKIGSLTSNINDRISGKLTNFVFIEDQYPCITKFKGNITLRSPLAAVEFLRTKAYDINLAPFFVYNKIGVGVDDVKTGDTVFIQSLSSIMDDTINPIYYANDDEAPYNYTSGFVGKGSKPGEALFYQELKKRILSLNADLQVNKLKQASIGVYGNSLQVYDYTAKDYISKRYDPYAEGVANVNTTRGADPYSGGGRSQGETYSRGQGIISQLRPPGDRPFQGLSYYDDLDGTGGKIDLGDEGAVTKYIRTDLHLPPPQSEQDIANGFYTAPEIYANTLNKSKYYYSRLQDDQNIEIEVYGDFNLNPGTKIELSFPEAKEVESDDPEPPGEDEVISGLYLVVVAIHGFINGLYKTRLKLVKLTQE